MKLNGPISDLQPMQRMETHRCAGCQMSCSNSCPGGEDTLIQHLADCPVSN